MAAIARPTEATYVTHEQVTVDTADHEDHTFCGIMFPVKCKELVPVDHIVITSVAVRGNLGPLTVWVSNEDDPAHQDNSFRVMAQHWTKIYERTHPPSRRHYCQLDLSHSPIRLRPGQVRAIYVHSTLPGDEAIVYDNRHSRRTYDDALISLLPGRAHVSERPFGTMPIWGWGNPWRDEREFVGRIEYGAVFRLWNPNEFRIFGDRFQQLTRTLFLCQRRWESNMSRLPDDCIFYILNMCRWDWAGDTAATMKDMHRRRKSIQLASEEVAMADAIPFDMDVEEDGEAEVQASSCCQRTASALNESDESEYEEAQDDDDEGEDDLYEDEEGNVYRVVEAAEDVDIEEDVDEEIDEDDDDDDDDEDWDEDDFGFGGHRNHTFSYRDDDSDEEDRRVSSYERGRRAWIRRQFARVQVLQVLNARARDMDDSST